ncbi:MAG: class II fructose-bisphosphate aldolase [Bacillota bacterium]|jgi:fructose/tagatose bisphosphate aldolase
MLLNGLELRAVFEHFCPFNREGELLPPDQRVTLLASNANLPLEVQARAFAMAAAAGEQSPMLVQISYNSAETIGNDPARYPLPAGVSVHQAEPAVVAGAREAVRVLEHYAQVYGAKYLALALDHFQVPRFDPQLLQQTCREEGLLSRRVAEARVIHAAEYMYPTFGVEAELSEESLQLYVDYLVSPPYVQFRRNFLATVQAVRPAWGMIDTEKLPPILDFVVTREIVDGVRQVLGNSEMMLEAEFGATGQSGQALEYERLSGDALENFAQQVACFIAYTGADGIAYPIGMEHAAKKDEKHEPDRERLEVVQRKLFETAGRYVPFAQHGGTGAASVVRGLVGKNNINTHYLVAGACSLADHVEQNLAGIRAGDKKYCGSGIFTSMIEAITQATLGKLEEAGSLNRGPELDPVLAAVRSNAVSAMDARREVNLDAE